MEKKRLNTEKLSKPVDETEELLNLDELLEVQGGIDSDEDATNCGLGCFLGGVY